jgi:hypothetical protein
MAVRSQRVPQPRPPGCARNRPFLRLQAGPAADRGPALLPHLRFRPCTLPSIRRLSSCRTLFPLL